MLKAVTEENTGDKLSGELCPLPGGKQNKAPTAKYTEMVIAG